MSDQLDLSAGVVVAEVLFDVLSLFGPVVLQADELTGLGSTLVAYGGDVLVELKDLQLQGNVILSKKGPQKRNCPWSLVHSARLIFLDCNVP